MHERFAAMSRNAFAVRAVSFRACTNTITCCPRRSETAAFSNAMSIMTWIEFITERQSTGAQHESCHTLRQEIEALNIRTGDVRLALQQHTCAQTCKHTRTNSQSTEHGCAHTNAHTCCRLIAFFSVAPMNVICSGTGLRYGSVCACMHAQWRCRRARVWLMFGWCV